MKKSILSMLTGTFSSNTAPTASTPMRTLAPAEAAAVAGGPDFDHDPYLTAPIVVPPPAA